MLDTTIITIRTISMIAAFILIFSSQKVKSPILRKKIINFSLVVFSICLFMIAMQIVTFHKNPWHFLFYSAETMDWVKALVAGLASLAAHFQISKLINGRFKQ